MAIGISIVAVYILGLYSLLNMKYVTVKVAHPAHPNKTLWVSRLSSFYTDNKVVIDILYNHLLSLTIPCLSLVVVVVATSITVGKLRATLAWRQETANKPSSGQAGSGGTANKPSSGQAGSGGTANKPSSGQANSGGTANKPSSGQANSGGTANNPPQVRPVVVGLPTKPPRVRPVVVGLPTNPPQVRPVMAGPSSTTESSSSRSHLSSG